MENLKTFGKLLALIALVIVAGAFVFFFAFWVFIAFLGAMGLILLAWAIGAPITIKERGVKTGYVRWFTFYPIRNVRNY
jgi:hypothetical protein